MTSGAGAVLGMASEGPLVSVEAPLSALQAPDKGLLALAIRMAQKRFYVMARFRAYGHDKGRAAIPEFPHHGSDCPALAEVTRRKT